MQERVPAFLRSAVRRVRRWSPLEREFARNWPLIDSVDGWLISPDHERWLFRAARSLPRGATIVEIGSYLGRSTACLAFGCGGMQKRVYAIDTFAGNNADFVREGSFLDEFRKNIERCGLQSCVIPIRGRSSEVSKAWDRPIDLLFIDGSHRYEDVMMDFRSFFPHVLSGGIVAVHDVVEGWPGPVKAWNEAIKPVLENVGRCTSLAYGFKPRSRDRGRTAHERKRRAPSAAGRP